MNEIQITTEQFLEELLGSTEANIYFNVNLKTWKNKPQTYSEAQPKLQRCNNIYHEDICFIPNSGGSKNDQITKINSLFIDWDAGKDPSDKYFPLEVVRQKKQKFLQKLGQFPHIPTYVIETRNGYHVYWFLYPGATSEQFIRIQRALIKHFKSDPKVCNPARVMRLPGYSATKIGKYESFEVHIIEHSPVRYTIDTFISHFSIDISSFHKTEDSNSIHEKVSFGAHNNSSLTNKDNTHSIIMGTYRPSSNNNEPLLMNTMEEVIDYISKQNIADYMGLGNSNSVYSKEGLTLNCLFHNDQTPSASIYYHNEHCYYKCHSSNCSFDLGTLIQVVQRSEKLEKGDAIKKLMDYYKIKIDEDNWKEKEQCKINHNIEILKQCRIWNDEYPNLYNWIYRIADDLESKLVYALDHIVLRTFKGKGVFICSLTEFERISKKNSLIEDQNRQNERVDRYCLLGLMDKLDDNDIPWGVYNIMQNQKGLRRQKYRIQCYHIPEYTPELLQKADDIARIGKERGIKMNSITKNSIRDIYGEDMAKKVYPQIEDVSISESSQELSKSIEQVVTAEIQERGYTKVSQIIQKLTGIDTWKSVHDRRIKSLLPGLLDKLSLIEITVNNEMKEKYNIISKGYPKIIIPRLSTVEDTQKESHSGSTFNINKVA